MISEGISESYDLRIYASDYGGQNLLLNQIKKLKFQKYSVKNTSLFSLAVIRQQKLFIQKYLPCLQKHFSRNSGKCVPHFVIVLLKSTSASSSRRQKRYVKSENDCVAWDFSLALELLITRRSSVQIWLPQPGTVIFKITERKRKARSFGTLSRLRAFLLPFFKNT